MKKKLIGYVAVDSGHLMVCDPCYIKSEWKDAEFEDIRRFKDTTTGEVYEFRKDFPHFEAKIEGFKNTVNELLASGRFKQIAESEDELKEFSYDGSCKATHGKSLAGSMRFSLGHEGAGVSFMSGNGDGFYPVYAFYNKEGRIMKVEIRMN